MKNQKVWLITGSSQGLGLATIRYLLNKGQIVFATTRDSTRFSRDLFEHPHFHAIALDLTKEEEVKMAIGDVYKKYQRIDVLVNNAGYGFVGAVEEASVQEIHQVVDINVHATIRMIRHVLPYMRGQRNGHIINISSMAGLISSAGWGIYNLTKYAVEGFSEALYHELIPLGIHVTILEPGAFRTRFLAGSLTTAATIISDYDTTAGNRRRMLAGNNGHQPNDPEKAAAAIFQLIHMENPPLRLLLGQDAYDRAFEKIRLLQQDFQRMKNITLSTGF